MLRSMNFAEGAACAIKMGMRLNRNISKVESFFFSAFREVNDSYDPAHSCHFNFVSMLKSL